MDINNVISGLDKLFAEKKIKEAETYLKENLDKAKEEKDNGAALILLNEQIGYYRSISRMADSLNALKEAKEYIKLMELTGTEHEATTLLNGATALRAAESYAEAMQEYLRVEEIYKKTIDSKDYRFAGLYNNMSLLYSALEQYKEAGEKLEQALAVLETLENSEIEQAITYTNMAVNYGKLQEKEAMKNALNKALQLFEEYTDNKDAHYAAALSGLAGVYFEMGEWIEAAKLYQRVCEDIRSYFGENMAYAVSLVNLAVVYRTMGDLDQAEVLMNQAECIRRNLQ